LYFRALALAIVIAAAHWGWVAYVDRGKLAASKDLAAAPDRVVLLGAPPRLPMAKAEAPFGAVSGLVSTRIPVEGFRSETALRRELSP